MRSADSSSNIGSFPKLMCKHSMPHFTTTTTCTSHNTTFFIALGFARGEFLERIMVRKQQGLQNGEVQSNFYGGRSPYENILGGRRRPYRGISINLHKRLWMIGDPKCRVMETETFSLHTHFPPKPLLVNRFFSAGPSQPKRKNGSGGAQKHEGEAPSINKGHQQQM